MMHISGLNKLPKLYKGFLLDQFGVLHNGKNPYPKAIEAVKYLNEIDGKIAIISNSSGRSLMNAEKINKFGFNKESFFTCITSGELTYQYLKKRPNEFWKSLGNKCLHFNWHTRTEKIIIENLEYVTKPEACEFILVHGNESMTQANGKDVLPMTIPEIEKVLLECSKLNKKPSMIVANPDLVLLSVGNDGPTLIPMSGVLGKYYESIGGHVVYMGKPSNIIYEEILNEFKMDKSEILAIGDSLSHDIQGAMKYGIDSLFIGGGIHMDDIFENERIDEEKLKRLCEREGFYPNYYTEYLSV